MKTFLVIVLIIALIGLGIAFYVMRYGGIAAVQSLF